MMTRLLSHRTIFLGSSIYCAYRWIFKRNTAISMIAIDKTQSKHIKIMLIYKMNFTLCVLLVYNDNGSVQTLCTYRANARYAKCLQRPIVIINQQYTKGEIHFINNYSTKKI